MKNKKPVKTWWVQKWGTYQNEMPVFVGYTPKEILAVLKKQKTWKQEPILAWEKELKQTEEFAEGREFCWFNDGYCILFLKPFEDKWERLEAIMHECFHLVINILGDKRGMINTTVPRVEEEAMAYQQEYLFREIRRKLQDKYHGTKK